MSKILSGHTEDDLNDLIERLVPNTADQEADQEFKDITQDDLQVLREVSLDEYQAVESFLRDEFKNVHEWHARTELMMNSRIDTFLNITFATVGGVGLLWQFGSMGTQEFLILVLFGSLILLGLGILILLQVIQMSQLSSEYIRAHNRLRRFFILCFPFINGFVRLPSDHRYPPFYWRSSSRPLVEVVNSLLLAIGVVVGLTLLIGTQTLEVIPIIVGGVSFFLVWIFQELYSRFHAQSEQNKAKQYEQQSQTSPESIYQGYRSTLMYARPGYMKYQARRLASSGKEARSNDSVPPKEA